MLGVLVILGMRTLTEECEELVLQTLSYITVRVCERKIAEQGERAAAGSVLDEVLFQEHKSAEIIRRRLENDGFQLQELYAFVILSLREPEPRSARFGLVEFCCSQIERSFEKPPDTADREVGLHASCPFGWTALWQEGRVCHSDNCLHEADYACRERAL